MGDTPVELEDGPSRSPSNKSEEEKVDAFTALVHEYLQRENDNVTDSSETSVQQSSQSDLASQFAALLTTKLASDKINQASAAF